MNKLNVVVSANMNNFDILTQGVEIGGYEVYFHRDPKVSIIDGVVKYNFDLMITDGNLRVADMIPQEIVPAERLLYIPRYNKQVQSIRIANWLDANVKKYPALETFVPVKSWLHRQVIGSTNLVQPDTKVVIKAIEGARGIGQWLIDPNKIPMVVAIDAIDRFRLGRIELNELVEELCLFDPSFQVTSGSENEDGEGGLAIIHQGYMIQSFIPNVKNEYRLLTNHKGEVVYCQQRSIKAEGAFPQATGSGSNSIAGDDIVDIKDVLSATQVRALCALIKNVVGPMSSIDLFTTEDGGWGIFEYCNQFGIKGVPMALTTKIHLDCIADMIRKAGL